MPSPPLVLTVTDYTGPGQWSWRLTDGEGCFLADHAVALAAGCAEYHGFLDLPEYLDHYAVTNADADADPQRRAAERQNWLGRYAAWLKTQAFGDIATVLENHAPVTVRVVVPAAAQELALRPLEVALDDVSLVFEVEGDRRGPDKQPVAQALRLLAVFSLPPAASPLNLREERQALRALVGSLTGGGRPGAITLRVLQYGTSRQTLAAALEEEDGWDIVHFSGHGESGSLVLEGGGGAIDPIDAPALAKLLGPTRRRLKLITVSACHSAAPALLETLQGLGIAPGVLRQPAMVGVGVGAETSRDAARSAAGGQAAAGAVAASSAPIALQSVARHLARELDCAVLAMRFAVEDAFAIALADGLYRGLLKKGWTLPSATRQAVKQALERARPGPLARATPALFGRQAVALRVNLPPAAVDLTLPSTGLFEFPPEPERFVGRVALMTAASAALAEGSGRTGVLFHGMAGAGKSACALELAYHLEPTRRFQAFAWYKAPDVGADISGALSAFAQALERQLPNFEMIQVVGHDEALTAWLPRLRAVLEQRAILLVLDNIESLLSADGAWRDPQFGRVAATLLSHRGLSRTVLTSRLVPAVLTSRVVPAALDPRSVPVLVAPVHALPLAEALLLMREFPGLGALARGSLDDRRLARRVLAVVQGHPKLIALAAALAHDKDALSAQVAQAEAEAAAGGRPLAAFFTTGNSTETEAGFLESLNTWTTGVTARLPAASRTLFGFLCALEENDRQSGIVAAVWPDLWQRLALPAPPPALATTLTPLVEAALVEPVTIDEDVTRYHLHPGVAECGRSAAGPALGAATDQALGDLWEARFRQGWVTESTGGGPLIIHAGMAAAPYLMRRQAWAAAGTMLEQVVYRDESPATLATVLPWLRRISQATIGSEQELGVRGVLARALTAAGQRPAAEAELRAVIAAAVTRGEFWVASATTGALITLLGEAGQREAALALIPEKQDYTGRAAAQGPWPQLDDEARRLQLLADGGAYDQVLQEVAGLRPRMAALSEHCPAAEAVLPWNVREAILDCGHTAALHSGRWALALELNAAVRESQVVREAPALEQAATRFNDTGPLLRLGRLDEAAALLADCRRVFERENHVAGLGKTLSALAQLERRRGRLAEAAGFERQALRYSYQAGEPGDCAISHFDLADYLLYGAGEAGEALAHRLAAGVLSAFTGSGRLQQWVPWLAIHLARLDPAAAAAAAALPGGFATVVATVERTEGVYFEEMVTPLAAGRDLDALLAELIARARSMQQSVQQG